MQHYLLHLFQALFFLFRKRLVRQIDERHWQNQLVTRRLYPLSMRLLGARM